MNDDFADRRSLWRGLSGAGAGADRGERRDAGAKGAAARTKRPPSKPKAGFQGGRRQGRRYFAGGGERLVDERDIPVGKPPADASPMAELKKSNDQLDKLLRKKYPNWSPEAEAQKAAVRKLVGGFLDYRELARRSLAKHWDSLSRPSAGSSSTPCASWWSGAT